MAESPSKRLERIGSAAAGVAHDINNELMLVLNYLSVADIEAARVATRRCAGLTSRLLSYCRGDEPVSGGVDSAAWLREFAEDLTLPANVRLELELPAALPPIQADPVSLHRVLINLINNAFDAMKDQGTLRIRASVFAIHVEDSGPGIPTEDREKVFDSLYTTKSWRGTGLGLSIARFLMREQGGTIRLVQGPQGGACFELRFRPAAQVL
jgi:two-component system NtrC family sensor kinase